MIKYDNLRVIGEFFKPHGIKGEISARITSRLHPDDLRCVVMDVDGIYVPFFISSSRPRGTEGGWLLKIDGIDSAEDASMFIGRKIYGISDELPEKWLDSDGVTDEFEEQGFDELIGFKVFNLEQEIGSVVDIDDSTENILMQIRNPEGDILLIPFAEGLIEEFDEEERQIIMNLPQGIFDIN